MKLVFYKKRNVVAMAINRNNLLKNKVRFRHKHESKDELLENIDLASFRYGIEDNAEWLKDLEDDPDSLNTKQLIVLDELR
ncbi:hypothetical protein [Brevibacillus laterosporus]|uniref:hypothetical protein n=1 Tax=Brevibacillus laterosporus TaxID=1465 RepID=UPI003D1DDAF8